MNKIDTAKKNLNGPLKNFMGTSQRSAIASFLRGEEGVWYADKIIEMTEVFEKMPKPYSQEKLGMNAIVGLHYFYGGGDWWITELGDGIENHSFGFCAPFGVQEAELGYVSIEEIIATNRVELDLHWTPTTIEQVKARNL